MDKRMVMALYENGWSLTRIARRVHRSKARICQIVKDQARVQPVTDHNSCEICGQAVDGVQFLAIEDAEVEPFLVCEPCIGKYGLNDIKV